VDEDAVFLNQDVVEPDFSTITLSVVSISLLSLSCFQDSLTQSLQQTEIPSKFPNLFLFFEVFSAALL